MSRLLDEKLEKLLRKKLESESEKNESKPPTPPQINTYHSVERENGQRKPIRSIVCNYCGKIGHVESRCYFKQRDERKENKRVHNPQRNENLENWNGWIRGREPSPGFCKTTRYTGQ